jgi:hypothetical protein
VRIQTREAEPSHPKKLVSILDCTRNAPCNPTANRRWRSRSRVRGRGRAHAAGACRFFQIPRPLGDPRAPVPRGAPARHPPRARRGPRTLGRAPMCGPPRVFTANSHRAHVRLTSDRSRACIRRARTRLTTAFTRHTTRGRRVPPTPDHRPSRPRPDASITVGSEGVRLMARARPL